MINNAYRRLGVTSILISALIVASASSGASSGVEKRTITEMDLFKFVWIADPQISPDGSRVAFVRVWVNQKADRYDSALWIAPTNGGAARQLTTGPRDASPRWSPDGKRIYFTANRAPEPYYEPQRADLYSIAPDGSDEMKIVGFGGQLRGYSFSDDGKRIAFSGSMNRKPIQSYTQPDLFVVDNVAEATKTAWA